VSFNVVQDTVEMYTDYATVFFLLYLYIHALTIVGSLFVFYLFSNTPRTQKKQTGIVLAASCLPWLVSTGEVTFYMSGSYIDVLMNFSSLTLAAVLYYIGTFTFKHSDVTPLSYDAVVENMDDGVMIIDFDGALGYANSTAREVLGLGPEVMGRERVGTSGLGAVLWRPRGLIPREMVERQDVQREDPPYPRVQRCGPGPSHSDTGCDRGAQG
jgi:PAS domain-containing protein